MDKTPEQKEASKQRFLQQRDKAIQMMSTYDLLDFLNGLEYAYSLSIRYRAINLKKLVESSMKNVFDSSNPKSLPLELCLKGKILNDWNNTYWYDKEKAASLREYISERR